MGVAAGHETARNPRVARDFATVSNLLAFWANGKAKPGQVPAGLEKVTGVLRD